MEILLCKKPANDGLTEALRTILRQIEAQKWLLTM